MNEVSTVVSLVFKILGFVIAVGCAGTLYEATVKQRESAVVAIRKDQMSYLRWNKQLHRK